MKMMSFQQQVDELFCYPCPDVTHVCDPVTGTEQGEIEIGSVNITLGSMQEMTEYSPYGVDKPL